MIRVSASFRRGCGLHSALSAPAALSPFLPQRHHRFSSSDSLPPAKEYLFDIDTKVSKSNIQAAGGATTAAEVDTFTASVTNNWSVGDAPNGGYLMVLAISAARNVVPFRDPITVTGSFFQKAVEGRDVDIEVTTISKTKSTATVMVAFKQAGTLCSNYIGTFGTLKDFQGLSFNNLKPPQLSAAGECMNVSKVLRKHMGDNLRVAQRVEFYVPNDHVFVKSTIMKDTTAAVTEASLDCWVAFADGRSPCLRSLAFFCDALPPPVLNLAASNWVPTLQYTVHFWRRPTAASVQLPQSEVQSNTAAKVPVLQWLRGRFFSPMSCNGLLYTDGEMWSADGTELLATSRQIARLLVPR